MVTAAIAVAACAVTGLVPLSMSPAASSAEPATAPAAGTYTNPVTDGYSIDFPDPSMIRGKDGYWYAYATGGPYDESGASDPIKMARSTDLVHWHGLGAVFGENNRPTWASATTGFWAPDIRYVNGHYLLYYVTPDSSASTETYDPGIGVATAPSPAGPWTDSGAPIVTPERDPAGGWKSNIDPSEFTDTSGRRYLYYGSYGNGVRVVPLSDDGMHVTGPLHQVASTRFEGSYVTEHDGWYYLTASSANCCAGPTTGYTVFAGRSRSPLGPFLDRNGVSLAASRSGGTVVIAPTGNRFVGTGHSAIVTDLTGSSYLAYHAVERDHPYLDGSPGFTMRPMLLDRLDWIDGWPIVRGGRYASDSPQPDPVTRGAVDDAFGSAAGTASTFRTVAGRLTVRPHDTASDAGGYARLSGGTALALARQPVPGNTHLEADVRAASGSGTVGLLAGYRGHGSGVRAVLDADRHQLRVSATVAGRAVLSRSVRLPSTVDPKVWHNLAVDVDGGRVTATLTDARLDDPYATVSMRAPRSVLNGTVGLVGSGTVDVDNVSAAALFRAHISLAPLPKVGPIQKLYSDDFSHGLSPAWSWLRKDAAAQVTDGSLVWPTEDTDLSGDTASQAGVLLRDPPTGNWTVETKLTLDVGVDTIRNFQQAGLVVYTSDQDFLRLDHVAAGPTRFVEFGKRVPVDGLVSWGGAIIGPPAATTRLRIVHTVDPATGQNRYQAGSSPDNRHWTWGTVWTMPAGSHPRVGLVSQGSSAATDARYGKATAAFDYVRFYRS